MPTWCPTRSLVLFAALGALAAGHANAADQPSLPSETPADFKPRTESFDFVKRVEMIPMRDGVKLKTIVLVPKAAANAPMLLVRTPYNAARRASRASSPRLASIVPQMLDTAVAAGTIVVYQDVRGKFGSEGDYVLTRPLRGPLNPTEVDHATDCYDTIDWLVRNVPETNGRVGTIGGSYEGYTAVMSTVNPHPALKVAVPFAPMVDAWMGDDWFHNGAFRQLGTLEFIHFQQAARAGGPDWWRGEYDAYDTFLRAGSAGAVAASRGLEQLGFWRKIAAHPSYDEFWQEQAVDKLLARRPLAVPMLIVAGLFDQEDIYGGPALFRALAPKDPDGKLVHLVLGPWNHAQGRGEGRGIGAISFEGDTAALVPARSDAALPRSLPEGRSHAHDAAGAGVRDGRKPLARVRRLAALVRDGLCRGGAASLPSFPGAPRVRGTVRERRRALRRVRLRSGEAGALPAASDPVAGRDGIGLGGVAGRRPASRRHAHGRARLRDGALERAASSRRAADRPALRLDQRDRLRLGREADRRLARRGPRPPVHGRLSTDAVGRHLPGPLPRGSRPSASRSRPASHWPIPSACRRRATPSCPGHRVMVQIQSTWFPLYDRNPQTFVPNILFARPQDYVKATQRVWRAPGHASAIELPVIAPPYRAGAR